MSSPIRSITLLAAALSACGNGGAIGSDGGGGGRIGDDRTIDVFTGEHIYFGDPDRRTVDTEVALPGANLSYEKVSLHLGLACPTGGCDWWDRVGRVSVVDNPGSADEQEIEIARFVTPYRVGGDFDIDVTDVSSLLRGERTIRLFIDTWVGPGSAQGAGWSVDVSLDYTGGVPSPEPYAVIPVWSPESVVYGDPAQPTARQTIVTVPAGAGAVALRGIVTGHGQGNAENCAEFCSRDHTFSVGGVVDTRTIWRDDCQTTAVPDQQGTYTLARAGWCPGATVHYWFGLVSAGVPAGGGEVDVSYDVAAYENTCRPDATSCTGCVGGSCDYDGSSHTEPHYLVSALLVLYR